MLALRKRHYAGTTSQTPLRLTPYTSARRAEHGLAGNSAETYTMWGTRVLIVAPQF